MKCESVRKGETHLKYDIFSPKNTKGESFVRRNYIISLSLVAIGAIATVASIVLHYRAGAPVSGHMPSLIIQCVSIPATIIGTLMTQKSVSAKNED